MGVSFGAMVAQHMASRFPVSHESHVPISPGGWGLNHQRYCGVKCYSLIQSDGVHVILIAHKIVMLLNQKNWYDFYWVTKGAQVELSCPDQRNRPWSGERSRDRSHSGVFSSHNQKPPNDQIGSLNVPFWEYWTSPEKVAIIDHIPNGWVMWPMGTSVMTHGSFKNFGGIPWTQKAKNHGWFKVVTCLGSHTILGVDPPQLPVIILLWTTGVQGELAHTHIGYQFAKYLIPSTISDHHCGWFLWHCFRV